MRKSFAILLLIFVCALGASVGVAQSQKSNGSLSYQQVAAKVQGTATFAEAGFKNSALSASYIATRIAEAKRVLNTRSDSSSVARDSVTLAVLDADTSQTSIFSLPKDEFLIKGADLVATTQSGRTVRVQVVRANGVNTAVTVSDAATGHSLVPLTVEYPIVKNGSLSETAYYTSAHPALLSDDVSQAGQIYVRRMLDTAATNLANDGVNVSPDIVDIAEHLCIVEHTDHKRFLSENHGVLFAEILSLYALNQGDTFRYSVSTAGAGGMIQMIPRTYEMVRQQHADVSLTSDFVSGMREHRNALEAMLLYMNDTWNSLAKSAEVQQALRTGIATKPELMAAGYNSNPMRLPQYLKNGGAGWRSLIPAETQMYLAIYSSVDQNVDLQADKTVVDNTSGVPNVEAMATTPDKNFAILSWLGQSLLRGSAFTLFPMRFEST